MRDISREEDYTGSWDFAGPGGHNELHGGAGNDQIILELHLFDIFSGLSRNNSIYGDQGDDTIRVLGASAYIDGGDGNDRITLLGDGIYDNGGSVVHGGAGNDKIFLSGYGSVSVYGGDGDDIIYGAARDRLTEAVIWNKYSPGGLQVIDGGAGRDRIFCFSYTQDTIVMDFGGGRDVARNFNADPGEEFGPVDLIDFTAFDLDLTPEEFIATRVTSRGDRVVLRPDESATLVIWGVEAEDLVNSLLL
ncbi:MAG: calcium-binding protein [Paracoccus sp. (in: a-proteobacteria)]